MKIKTLATIFLISLVNSFFLNPLINQRVLAQTSDEIRRLKEVGVPVIMPTYMPSGFWLVDSKFVINEQGPEEKNNIYQGTGWYEVVYKGPNNSCYKILGTDAGMGDGPTLIRQWAVNNNHIGKVILEELILDDNIFFRVHLSFFLSDNADAVVYYFSSPSEITKCNRITVKEAIKIAESLQYINP